MRAGKVKGIIMSLHIYCTRLYLFIIAVNGFNFDLGLSIHPIRILHKHLRAQIKSKSTRSASFFGATF